MGCCPEGGVSPTKVKPFRCPARSPHRCPAVTKSRVTTVFSNLMILLTFSDLFLPSYSGILLLKCSVSDTTTSCFCSAAAVFCGGASSASCFSGATTFPDSLPIADLRFSCAVARLSSDLQPHCWPPRGSCLLFQPPA